MSKKYIKVGTDVKELADNTMKEAAIIYEYRDAKKKIWAKNNADHLIACNDKRSHALRKFELTKNMFRHHQIGNLNTFQLALNGLKNNLSDNLAAVSGVLVKLKLQNDLNAIKVEKIGGDFFVVSKTNRIIIRISYLSLPRNPKTDRLDTCRRTLVTPKVFHKSAIGKPKVNVIDNE